MNMSDINVQGEKSQSQPSNYPLKALDCQMAACGYGLDHPWRIVLADVISNRADSAKSCEAATGIDPVRRQAYEIESRIGNIAVLVEAIFDKIDALICVSPEQMKAVDAINTFANATMESAQVIRTANEEILRLASGGVQ